MSKNKNARKYAKMFLGAVGMDNAPSALKELQAVDDLMAASREFRSLLVSPVFTDEERNSGLRQVGAKMGMSESSVRFLGFLSAESSAGALRDVIGHAAAIYAEKKARVKAVVITPTAVGAAYEGRLKDSIKKLTAKDVDIEYAIDPSLLGGMLVKVGSTMYDGTIKGQLRLLGDELIRG